MISFTVPGRPVPAQRMTKRSKWIGRARKSLNYQTKVAWCAKAAGAKELKGDLCLTVRFYFRDKRHGDLSNLIKAIEDGLQYGQVMENDRQIKQYGQGTGIYFDKDERAEVELRKCEEGE